MLVDSFLGVEERRLFARRQNEVVATLDAYEVGSETILFGGAGLALHDINTYLPPQDGTTFDVDTLVPRQTFVSFRNHPDNVDRGNPNIIYLERGGAPLPLTMFKSLPDLLFQSVNFRSHKTADPHAVKARHQRTVPIENLLHAKVATTRKKDHAGVLKAAVFEHAEQRLDRSLVPLWSVIVRMAMDKARRPPLTQPLSLTWLDELVETDFRHPAFDMARETDVSTYLAPTPKDDAWAWL